MIITETFRTKRWPMIQFILTRDLVDRETMARLHLRVRRKRDGAVWTILGHERFATPMLNHEIAGQLCSVLIDEDADPAIGDVLEWVDESDRPGSCAPAAEKVPQC